MSRQRSVGVSWAVTAVVTAAGLFIGAAAARAADEEATRTQLEQKVRLVSKLISDSPTAQRITGSGNAQAVSHLDEGRVHHALAVELLARGDLAGARREVDDALRHLGLARRLAPDAPARQAVARQRHEQLLGSVERLIDAWRARVASQPMGDGGDLTAAVGLVGRARQQAQEGRYDEANQTLTQSQGYVLSGMNRTLHAATLDYTLRSASPAEAFQHELARHRGFTELLPLAIRDLNPRPDTLALIERYGETSSTLRAQALQQFQAGDTTQALAQIRSATLYAQRALLAAGVVAPQPIEATP